MHTPNFQNMSAEEFKAYRPRTEEEQDAHDKESEYRTRCEDDGEDFGDENTRAMYEEIELETGPSAWDDMDEDDRPGWEDNMNKDS